jgi:hypothetical protein
MPPEAVRLRRVVLVVVVTALTAYAAIAIPEASASCLIPGVPLACSPDPAPASALPAPDPGGSESPDQPVPAPGKGWGFNLGYQPDGDTAATSSLAALTAVGANLLRDGIPWQAFGGTSPSEPVTPEMLTPLGQAPAGSSLVHWDREYLDLTGHGITPIFILSNAPLWASTLHNCQGLLYSLLNPNQCRNLDGEILYPDPQFYPQWRQWIATMAARYPKAVIEGPNEPYLAWKANQSNPGTAPNAVDPSTAGDIQCQLFQAVRSVGGQTVLSMSMGDADYERGFIARAHGCYDGLSFHAYPYARVGSDTYFGQGSGLAQEFADARAARSGAGDTAPIWVTETGYSYVPGSNTATTASWETTYADASRRLYNRLNTMSDVGAVMFHTLRDDPGPYAPANDPSSTEYHFGFFNKDWTGKPSGCGFTLRHGATWQGC